ncbi:MAG: hypothetical protein IIZ18_03950 [Ruminococcus sp.]|nr:hypothetical protein [Ruminococcus sp.]
MNKFLKGAGIVLGIPLVLAASVFVFVPGLPGKLYVQKKCQSKDITIMEYQHGDVAVPEDFKELTGEGATVKVPADLEKMGGEGDSELKQRSYSNDNVTVVFMTMDSDDTFDMYEGETTPEQWGKLTKCFKGGCDDNNYSLFHFVADYTPDDINITKHGATVAAMSYAVMKDTLYRSGNVYYDLATDNAKGFLIFMGEKDGNGKYMIELYPNDHLNRKVQILVNAPADSDTLWQIINSADVAE